MKETYVFGMYKNGMVTPVIIRQEAAPLLIIGDKMITDKGPMVCISNEVGRYSDENALDRICAVMELGKDSLPIAIGTITERYWDDELPE